jgi:hypothetical protein
MPADVASAFRDDPDSPDQKERLSAGQLRELKDRIRAAFPDRVRDYEAN